MATMFDVTLRLANTLGVLRVSTATGGSTSNLTDTKRTEKDDTYNGGTVWLITDAGGESAAPEGEWPVITDFENTGGVITATFTVAPVNTDTYGIAAGRYPLDVLKSAINNEIIKYKQPRYDRTSLDIASGQSEYTLPAGITGDNLVNVYEETSATATDSKPELLNFWVQEAATGTQHTVVIDTEKTTAGNDLTLEYMVPLTPLYLATDTIDPIVPIARILPSAAAHCEVVRMRTYDSGDELDIAMLQFYRDEAREMKRENPVRRPAIRGKVTEA